MARTGETSGFLCSAALAILTGVVLLVVATFGWQVLPRPGGTPSAAGDAQRVSNRTSPPTSAAPTTPPSAPVAPPGGEQESTAAEIADLLTRVRILTKRPQVPGYERDCGPGAGCVFGTEWTDATNAPGGHNGCDTRNDVLAQALTDVTFSSRSPSCDVVGGTLTDPYTGTVMDYATDGSEIHIDHLFPLAAAWDLGAASWTLERRTEFANDAAVELIAVQGTANMSKGDSTPASWLPPRKAYRCTYVTQFLTAAAAYDLAITAADQIAIGHVADTC